ncbi:MAG TPA: EamA family transporter [Candidatus Limnocylindrales bacterium]|nr:EamA family transporter [Candidatus Limnocylindrales bacterium]
MGSVNPSGGDRAVSPWSIWTALVTVYLVWGSTYLAIAVVVQTMPPLLSAGGRFLLAGALMAGFVALRRGPAVMRLSRPQLAGSAFVGLTLLLGGNGLVMIGEQSVPSGLAALIIAVVPLWVVGLRLLGGDSIARGTTVGVLVGFAGVAVLVIPRGIDGTVELAGMLMLIAAAGSWAVGSFYSKRLSLPADPLASTAAQMLLGGAGLVAAGLLAGEVGLLQAGREFSTESMLALAYLVVFGSIVGFTAYTWLLQHAPVSKVATYAYVNPVVAILLGWLILSEEIGLTIVVGGAMIVLAVGLVLRTESRPRTTLAALDAPPTPAALPATVEVVDDQPAQPTLSRG